jgi:hypothetical protein
VAYFDIQPFASTNPAVGQLFAAEFAQRQAQRQADAQAAAQEIARQQIQAQSQLAQSQQQANLQQQQYNNLFREREFQSREKDDAEKNALFKQQLGIQQQNADTEKAARVPRTEAERRKAAIIDANSNAMNDAARANALYQINVDGAVAAAKKALPMGAGLFGGTTAANLDDPNHPARKLINKQEFDAVRAQLLAEKSGALNSLIPDPNTFTFKPVQYDETGKAIALPMPTAGSNYDYMGNPVDNAGAASALGTSTAAPVPSATTATTPMATAVPTSKAGWLDYIGGIDMRSLFGMKPVAAISPPIVSQPSVRRAFGNSTILLSPEDDATLARQLLAIPTEQRPAAYRAMVDQWLQAGRAHLAPAAIPVTPEPNYPRF